METNDLTTSVIVQPRDLTPIDLLNSAIARGIDADGIVKLADVFERMETKRAEQEFTQSLLNFRRDCPPLPRTTPGAKDALFLPLPQLAFLIDPILTRHELVYSFNTTIEENSAGFSMKIECILRHLGGFSTHTFFTTPIDKAAAEKMKMTDTHAGASASSLGKRYALQLALGLVTGLPDDDGRALVRKISPEQVSVVKGLLEETRADTAAFLKYARVTALDDISSADYGRIEAALLEKRRGLKAKVKE